MISKQQTGPLAGLKVVEFEGLGPCPLAGQFLGDLGAEIILITRVAKSPDPTDINRRNKLCIALDLKSETGKDAALALIKRADCVIEGFRPGVMERLALGPDDCEAINPTLVYGRITGWGQDGPLAQTAGHDINYMSLCGALFSIGKEDEAPIPPLNFVADYGGGTMFLLLGLLAALFERQHSGKGQVIDAAMVDGVPAMMALLHSWYAQGQWQNKREANLLDGAAPFYRCYLCKDGKSIAVGCLEPQFFKTFVTLAELPVEHCSDQNDQSNWPQRRAEYTAHFLSRSRDEWMAIFEGSDACVSPVLDWEERMAHPHAQDRGSFVEIGGVLQAQTAPRFSRSKTGPIEQPRENGDGLANIFDALGYSQTEINDLIG